MCFQRKNQIPFYSFLTKWFWTRWQHEISIKLFILILIIIINVGIIIKLTIITYWLFFSIKENFNWRIIALRYCVGFCCTTTWISYNYTYIPFLLSLPSYLMTIDVEHFFMCLLAMCILILLDKFWEVGLIYFLIVLFLIFWGTLILKRFSFWWSLYIFSFVGHGFWYYIWEPLPNPQSLKIYSFSF